MQMITTSVQAMFKIAARDKDCYIRLVQIRLDYIKNRLIA